MSSTRDSDDLHTFEGLRPTLIALAYRMLGDAARAQDLVQEAWLRWHGREQEVISPRAFLVKVVTRLCLNELDSRRHRVESSLPEPVDLQASGMSRLEAAEQISIAFLVMLERLTPPERAVLLLHEVFDYEHEEIATLIECNLATSRKLLQRARTKVSAGRKSSSASRAEHERLLSAFLLTTQTGDTTALVELLAPDVTLITDGGPDGRTVGRIRNLSRPLLGAKQVAAFIVAASSAAELTVSRHELNGSPALVFRRHQQPFGALSIEVSAGKIQSVFFQGDPRKLRFLGAAALG
jgi:RNA polymerase sigma-70 factor, ECF subfamily